MSRSKSAIIINLILGWGLIMGASACDSTSVQSSGAVTASTTTAIVANPTATLALNLEVLRKLGPTPYAPPQATAYAKEVARVQRLANLPPRPTITIGPPPPSPTPALGLIDGPCSSGIRSDPTAHSCWQGFVDNILYRVAAGMRAEERDTIYGQGSVWILRPDLYEHAGNTPLYDTPQPVGDIHIVAVNGTRFTIAPAHPESPQVTFIFDMMTHQWFDANGTPVPTATPVSTAVP